MFSLFLSLPSRLMTLITGIPLLARLIRILSVSRSFGKYVIGALAGLIGEGLYV